MLMDVLWCAMLRTRPLAMRQKKSLASVNQWGSTAWQWFMPLSEKQVFWCGRLVVEPGPVTMSWVPGTAVASRTPLMSRRSREAEVEDDGATGPATAVPTSRNARAESLSNDERSIFSAY